MYLGMYVCCTTNEGYNNNDNPVFSSRDPIFGLFFVSRFFHIAIFSTPQNFRVALNDQPHTTESQPPTATISTRRRTTPARKHVKRLSHTLKDSNYEKVAAKLNIICLYSKHRLSKNPG